MFTIHLDFIHDGDTESGVPVVQVIPRESPDDVPDNPEGIAAAGFMAKIADLMHNEIMDIENKNN
jgi:hypothetical protein